MPELRMERLKHIDLFSGIGGFSLACEWAGIETILFCECDKFCQKVLKKHWLGVPIIEDVNNVEEIKQVIANATSTRGKRQRRGKGDSTRDTARLSRCDDSLLLTAGFPCQPFSNAGRKRGSSDDRYLWPQTLAVIEAVKPDWIILENVPGILNMVFPDSEVSVASQTTLFGVENDEICDYSTISGRIESDLRQAGYETVWLVIPACGVGAPHRRDRVWIVANARQQRERGEGSRLGSEQLIGHTPEQWTTEGNRPANTDSHVTNTTEQGLEGAEPERPVPRRCVTQCDSIPGWSENWYEVATRFCRMDARIPDRVDRLKSLGNAIVPQVAYELIIVILRGEQ